MGILSVVSIILVNACIYVERKMMFGDYFGVNRPESYSRVGEKLTKIVPHIFVHNYPLGEVC